MADDSKESDQGKIESSSAMKELAKRKNDVGSEKPPSSSIPQKRPSPNSNVNRLSPKRINALRHKSFGLKKESNFEAMIQNSSDSENNKGNNDAHTKNPEDEKSSVASCSQNDESDNNQSASNQLLTSNNSKPISVDVCLTNEKFMEDFKTKWSDKTGCYQTFNNGSIHLYNKPFKICIISEFLEKASFIQQIVNEMSQMEWHRKQMDLYEFHQTTDLANLAPNAKPALKSFHNMLLNEMLPWMKQITGLPLTRISASCSMYNCGDYLLVHDDLLSDRQIAFVFYLSPWCDEWKDEMGGALELFESDSCTGQPKYPVVRKFAPRNNQFVFFRVCKDSFHQVGEVTNFVYPRLTINGWFHGGSGTSHESDCTGSDVIEGGNENVGISTPEYQPPNSDEIDLNEWINSSYLRKRVKQGIQQHIEDKSEASLEMFLISEFFDLLVSEFKENTDWVLEGPANQRKYESIHFTSQSTNTTGPLKDLYTLFTSDSMFKLLHEYTELDLYGDLAQNPTCSVQLCRFTQGCYTLLGDSSSFNDSALDVILFFNAREGVGKITYLSPSQDINEYNTTVDTDATTSSMDVSGMDVEILYNSTILNNTPSRSNASKNVIHKVQSHTEKRQNTSETSNTSKIVETLYVTKETTDVDISSQSLIMKNFAAINSACAAKKLQVHVDVHENYDDSFNEIDSNHSELTSDNEEFEELAQENALLTIHPKNNSLNLIYRLSGQTKFVKYISKNSLKPGEYIYVLFASYKE